MMRTTMVWAPFVVPEWEGIPKVTVRKRIWYRTRRRWTRTSAEMVVEDFRRKLVKAVKEAGVYRQDPPVPSVTLPTVVKWRN